MSNRLFQGIVHQMKDAIDRTIGVIDETSVVIACSELGKIGEVNESINSETLSSTAPFVINGYTYKSFGSSCRRHFRDCIVRMSAGDRVRMRIQSVFQSASCFSGLQDPCTSVAYRVPSEAACVLSSPTLT